MGSKVNKIEIDEVVSYVENNIKYFHVNRIEKLKRLQLKRVLKRKNPYLFKAKNVLTPHQIVEQFLSAHLSSQEETLFGEFLEGLAIFICERVYGGKKSSAEGIDLEFEKSGVKFIVSI